MGDSEPQEQLYRQLFDNAHDAILVFTPDTEVVLDVNQRACELYGFSREEFIGMSLHDISVDIGRGQRETQRTLHDGYYRGFRTVQLKRDGTPMQLEANAAVISYRGRTAILSVNRDISDRLAAQAREREMLERAAQQDRLAALGELAAGVAHDFNNMLQAIRTLSELGLREDGVPREVRAYLEAIGREGEKGSRIIGQILDFSRQGPAVTHPVSVGEVVAETVGLLQRTIPPSVDVGLELPETEVWVEADPVRIQQAVTNLVVNARDALAGGGGRVTVVVGTTPDDQRSFVRVVDDGPGVPDSVRNRIFEPFFTTKPRGSGTGLGLSQVYGIATLYRGTVEVESPAAGGAAFTMFLPSVIAPDSRVRMAPRAPESTDAHLVLVVDDNEMLREVISELVESIGYRTCLAKDAAQAHRVVLERRQEIAVVLTDLMMSGMGGLGLVARLREAEQDVPVIVMSGYPMPNPGPEGVDWIRKPFSRAELAERLLRAVESRAEQLLG